MSGRAEFEKSASLIAAVARAVLPADAPVEVNLVGERTMTALNRTYRGRKGASAILTFSYMEQAAPLKHAEDTAGEIYLCWKPLASEARGRRVSRRAYLIRLLVHGLCHLKGYRHEDETSEREMEKIEKRLLARFLTTRELRLLFA